jgi:HK97 family phage portal protein
VNPFQLLRASIGRRLSGKKSLTFVSVDGQVDGFDLGLPRTRYPYARDVRDGLGSNVVMAPVNWILRNFTEAELRMERRTDGLWTQLLDHPAVELIDRPNPFYDGDLLWKATLVSYVLDGNSYWLKIRNAFGEVVQLWYLPHMLVKPEYPRDGSEFISHYRYTPEFGGRHVDLAVEDVVHFRFGLDPRNVRMGLSPLKPLLREVFTDDEAANFSATILRNMGVPGGVIAPKDSSSLPTDDDVKAMKEYMRTAFTGDKRGEWLVLGTPTSTSQFGFDPQQLMVGALRDISEERVCAMLGVPAAVVGFGAGLQQTKVGATMKELRRLAWTSCLQPMQGSLARQLTSSLVPEFMSQSRRFRLWFDVSAVPAFQEEETEQARRVTLLVEKGVLRVDKAQEMLGLEVDPSQAVYLRPSGVSAVAEGDAGIVEPTPPPVVGDDEDDDTEPDANGNGKNRVRGQLEGSNGRRS